MSEIFRLLFSSKRKYEELGIGYINAYSLIIPKNELNVWIKRGWVESRKFRDFHYKPKENQTVVLSIPSTLKEKGVEYLRGKIIGGHTGLGTYGMGSPGFAGFSLSSAKESLKEYLVYAVYYADGYIFYDKRPLTGINSYYPWIPEETEKDFENWMDNHRKFCSSIEGMEIKDVMLEDSKLVLLLYKNNCEHILEFTKFDDALSTYKSGNVKSPAFKVGGIADYIVFQYQDAVLHT